MQIHGPPRKIYCIHQDLCLHLIGTQLKKKKVTMLKQNLKKKKQVHWLDKANSVCGNEQWAGFIFRKNLPL